MRINQQCKGRVAAVAAALLLLSGGCQTKAVTGAPATAMSRPLAPAGEIPATLKWSERMALSVARRNAWMGDVTKNPGWGYTQGLLIYACEQVYKNTRDARYLHYVQAYGDQMIGADGTIRTYKPETYNIDNINAGKSLFFLYRHTKEEKYRLAIEKLRSQLRTHPRTSEGGYWHKLKYPSQLWLDGAYMASPFLAQYARVFNDPQGFDEVALQLTLMEKHLRDPGTGLLYHGWDEKREQPWADPQTGRSRNFWSRALGWYAMALVDALDYFPARHPKRPELAAILQRLVAALQPYQDAETGLWYQVVDQGGRAGNYLEASGSGMFVYAMAKGVRKGYLGKKYLAAAEKGYQGLVTRLIRVKPDGEVNLLQVCEVAGLSADRDGSYEYYIREPIRIDDPKGTGPFILASLELNR